jgi:hypothetical protein
MVKKERPTNTKDNTELWKLKVSFYELVYIQFLKPHDFRLDIELNK